MHTFMLFYTSRTALVVWRYICIYLGYDCAIYSIGKKPYLEMHAEEFERLKSDPGFALVSAVLNDKTLCELWYTEE